MVNGRHIFAFPGGEQLTTIGASFFVSYLYFRHVDETHSNWQSVRTKNSRIRTLANSSEYHRAWLERIEQMSDAKLRRNSLGLEGATIKKMAQKILK
ncbi:MAG: hypothetical protein ABL896_18065, partial [Hylemonella sp.]